MIYQTRNGFWKCLNLGYKILIFENEIKTVGNHETTKILKYKNISL
jgi:hypothetical protein